MNDPLWLLNFNRGLALDTMGQLTRDKEMSTHSSQGGWRRGALFGYRMALAYARRLLRGIREKKSQGWRLLWVNEDTFQQIIETIPPGGYYEAQID